MYIQNKKRGPLYYQHYPRITLDISVSCFSRHARTRDEYFSSGPNVHNVI